MFIVIFSVALFNPISGYGIPGSFTTTTGASLNYSNFEGKYVLIEAFSTTCTYCKAFHPTLQTIYDNYGSNITMISVAYQSHDNMNTLKQWDIDYPSSWITALDYNFGSMFGVTGTPTTILFDTAGKEIQRWVGNQPYSAFQPVLDQIAIGVSSISTSSITNSESTGSVLGNLFGNQLFQLGLIAVVGIAIFLKASGPKKVE